MSTNWRRRSAVTRPVAPLRRVAEHHLVAAALDGLRLGDQAGRVVAAALGRAGAAGGSPGVVLRDPDADRLDATLEVGADRRGDHRVQVLGGGLDAEED